LYLPQIIYTSGPGNATELAVKAVEDGVDVVVAVGGDGTVNEVGQALVGTATAMAIIPKGSGNGLARHLKIPPSIKKSMEVINRSRIQKMDTATLNGKVFLSLAGVGFDAFVAKKFSTAGKRGFITYFRIVSGEYLHYKPKKYEIDIDGEKITRRALLVTFANSSQFGNNASIDPHADLSDGWIDVCIVRRIPFLMVPFYVPSLFLKSFQKTHFIEIIKAKNVTITRKKGKSVHFDGDPVDMGKVLEMKINPLSLNIIVP
ncbi:MAG: diacylglycerol kinase family protein, partial [Bacteroidota bacterium]